MAMTQADWDSLAQAVAAGGGTFLTAMHNQEVADLSGVQGGNNLSGGPGSVPATSTASGIGADAITQVETDFPDLAWMLNVPELGPLIVQMAQSGVTDSAEVTAKLQQTGWWKTHSDSVRNWIQEVETDPAQAQSDMTAQQSSLAATISSLGFEATGAQLSLLASQSLAMGWTDQEIKDNISQNISTNPDGTFSFNYAGVKSQSAGAGSLGASMDNIHAEAAKYLVPISDATAGTWATWLSQGHGSMDSVDAYLQRQAQSLYPSIAGVIEQGVTVADYVAPYKEVAAQLLGVDPQGIDMTQAKWQRPLSTPGPNGVPTAMSLYDWQQTLMQDPQYGYMNSVNAKDRASSIASGLGQLFGKSPSGPSGSTAFNDAGAPRIAGVPIT